MQKKCTKCKKKYEANAINFPVHRATKGGLFAWCRNCKHEKDNIYSRKYRAENPEWHKMDNQRNRPLQAKLVKEYQQKYPERVKAVNKVNEMIRDGKLERQPCVICNKKKVHGHHKRYDRPLEVDWLCARHHKALHFKLLTSKELAKLAESRALRKLNK